MNTTNADAMKKMAALAFESATEMLARHAEAFAVLMETGKIRNPSSGAEALRIFANAIRATNQERFRKPDNERVM